MTLKARIHAGLSFEIGMLSVDDSVEQIRAKAAGKAWDLAFVDLQHAPFGEREVVDFCQRAGEAEVPIMFRMHHPSATWWVGRLLDFGAAGILVPMVESPETVRSAVENFYYPPLGRRSCGLRFAYGLSSEFSPRGYADWWNENGILALQIETVDAVLRIRELVQPGADLLLFGAVDLSFSIGATPDCPFETVADCQQYVAEQTRDLDIRVGVADLPFGPFEAS